MAKNNQKAGLVLVLIGLFLLFSLSSLGDVQRLEKPVYDGQRDAYEIQIIDHSDTAEVGDIFSVDLEITNLLDRDGRMYVQCSILDRTVHTWLPQIQSVSYLGTQDNCVSDEPFTQTAIVSLDPLEQEIVPYTFRVPNNVGGDNVIYCATFEQCWAEDVDVMQSDAVVKQVILSENDGNDNNNNLNNNGGDCSTDDDCNSWFSLSEATCENGYCIDPVDNPEFPLSSLSASDLKDWASENKIMLVGLAFILVIIGAIIVYREPKPRGLY